MTQETGGFAALGLHPHILAALTAVGYEEPSPIQAQAIPVILAGHVQRESNEDCLKAK